MKFNIKDIKESTEFLQKLVNSLTSAVFLVDKEARIININDTAEVLFGQDASDFIGKLCGNGIKCMYVEESGGLCGTTEYCAECQLRNSILRTIAEKITVLRHKLTRCFYIHGMKIMKYLLYTTKFIHYNGDDTVLLIVDDVSEVEEQRLRLEELNKAKNRFLGIVAHDLRNPLSAIDTYTKFLQEDLRNKLSGEQQEFIESIISSTRFMNHLIRNLLTSSQIESGQLTLDMDEYDYSDTLAHNYKLNRVLAAKKGIAIALKIYDEIPLFRFDKNKIIQVLNNLIGNAIKYSNEGSRVTIEAGVEGDTVRTSVTDEGPGISKEDIAELFHEFARGSNRPAHGEESTGLGLLISKNIVEGHKGSIGVESVHGSGSKFFFTLPLISDTI
ncbi:MAG: PAS domain-containing protein [Brevinematales bacterium]|nr:PAS domain-containing protein [Brevinematales bacterium]